jgi:hypothetical protein
MNGEGQIQIFDGRCMIGCGERKLGLLLPDFVPETFDRLSAASVVFGAHQLGWDSWVGNDQLGETS